ncbi:MAG: hypothetical protein ACHQF2_09590 [Flavobacteriales bacterium]
MLELSKEILQKVSFDRKLFEKELRKALKWVRSEERSKLKMWCVATFGALYGDVISTVFESI